MAIVSKWNYFHTEAAAWMDVGIYRDASDSGDFTPFIIRRLEGFEDKKVDIQSQMSMLYTVTSKLVI